MIFYPELFLYLEKVIVLQSLFFYTRNYEPFGNIGYLLVLDWYYFIPLSLLLSVQTGPYSLPCLGLCNIFNSDRRPVLILQLFWKIAIAKPGKKKDNMMSTEHECRHTVRFVWKPRMPSPTTRKEVCEPTHFFFTFYINILYRHLSCRVPVPVPFLERFELVTRSFFSKFLIFLASLVPFNPLVMNTNLQFFI